MREPIKSFELNIKSIKELHTLHNVFQKKLPALDLQEMLRAEHVLIVSALDCYLHDIVRTKMKRLAFTNLDINNLPTDFKSFQIPLSYAKLLVDAENNQEKEAIITHALKETLYKFSFESEKTIDKALGYIGVKKIWKAIQRPMNMKPEDIKMQLSIIVRRRNNIAHQSDITNLSTMEKDPITKEDIEQVLSFIEKFVLEIDKEIKAQIH